MFIEAFQFPFLAPQQPDWQRTRDEQLAVSDRRFVVDGTTEQEAWSLSESTRVALLLDFQLNVNAGWIFPNRLRS
jgi:hypothetical protein